MPLRWPGTETTVLFVIMVHFWLWSGRLLSTWCMDNHLDNAGSMVRVISLDFSRAVNAISRQCSGVRWREQVEMATWTITFFSKQTALAALEPLPIHKILPTSPLIHLILDIPGACVLCRRHCHYWLRVRGETMSRAWSAWTFSAGVPTARGEILATIIRIHSGTVGPSWSVSEVPEWWSTSGSIHWLLNNALIQVWEEILLEMIRSMPRCYTEGLQVIHTPYYWIHRSWISLISQFFSTLISFNTHNPIPSG